MDDRYKDFVERNPTVQSRIEALTSGILSPDTKAITLWAMKRGEFYSASELYSRVKEFSGGWFPIHFTSVWAYCNGRGRWKGSLYNIGAVVKDKLENEKVLYAKSDAGADFGDALVVRALTLSERLNSKYKSMLTIFGAAQKLSSAKTRRGYAVYKIIKELVTNPQKEYRAIDLEDIIELPRQVLSETLNSLGKTGVIDYKSHHRDILGKKERGWALYSLKSDQLLRKNPKEVYLEIRAISQSFNLPGNLEKILEYIKKNTKQKYEYNNLSEIIKTGKGTTSTVLCRLERLGYLESEFNGARKKGKSIMSKIKSNQNTLLLWQTVLEPVEAIAYTLDPSSYSGFYEDLRALNENQTLKMQKVQAQLELYDKERTSKGTEGSHEIDELLLTLPLREMKKSEIFEYVKKGIKREIKTRTIVSHINHAVKAGTFTKTKKGIYRRV